jgi:hypothetical protein
MRAVKHSFLLASTLQILILFTHGWNPLGGLCVVNKGCVLHCGLVIYIKKDLKAKEELCKLKYFHHAKI